MRNHFKGLKQVYFFTLRQSCGKGFKVVTALVSILIIALITLIILISAKPDEVVESEPSPIEKVYVSDNSDLQPANYEAYISQIEQFQHVKFSAMESQSKKEVIEKASSDSAPSIAVFISLKQSGYDMEAFIPASSIIKKKQAEELLGVMSQAFQSNKLVQAGLSQEQLESVIKPAVTYFSEIGSEKSEVSQVVEMIAPMLFGLILYFMLILYGHSVSKSVAIEKTSKLIETLLTSVQPYALIAGKILAVTTMAIAQFLTWIIAAIAGLYAGNAVAHTFFPGYENSVISIINYLRDNIGEASLSLPSIILAVIFFCVGFFFYCVISGLAGCIVSKPEDVATTHSVYQFPIVISWIVTFLAPLYGNKDLLTAFRYIPFTAPFSVPVDLVIGNTGFSEGIIALAILLISCLLVIVLGAKIYKGLLLYTGQKLTLGKIGNILRQ